MKRQNLETSKKKPIPTNLLVAYANQVVKKNEDDKLKEQISFYKSINFVVSLKIK